MPGANVVAVEVLRFAASQNDSLYRTNTPCLYIEDCTADNPSFAGKNGWKCTINREIAIIGETGGPAPIHAQENVYATEFLRGGNCPDAAPKLILTLQWQMPSAQMTVWHGRQWKHSAAPSGQMA